MTIDTRTNPQKVAAMTKELAKANAEVETLLDLVAGVEEHLVKTQQRTLTAKGIETTVWRIWAFCRKNKDNLDSGTVCQKMMDLITNAVAKVQQRLEAALLDIRDLEKQKKILRAEIRRLTKENENALVYAAALEKQIASDGGSLPDRDGDNEGASGGDVSEEEADAGSGADDNSTVSESTGSGRTKQGRV